MAPHKDETELFRYQCPRLKATAHLKFVTRHFYSDAGPTGGTAPIKTDCSGRLVCGITPKHSETSWGATDWTQCDFLKSAKS